MTHSAARVGKVYLVGAGPGDPGLLTLRGAELLRQADLIVYDYLVNAELLENAAKGAEHICLGRHGQGRIMPQSEVNELLVRASAAGKTVVRLKAGDPLVFAQAALEIEALTTAGIPFEVVPGITAALAAGAYAGVPLTHRDFASAVALVTGRQQEGDDALPLDFDALARFPGTLVFYMGVTTAEHWSQGLLSAGKPAATPVAVIRRCSWPDQLTIQCTLGTVANELSRRHIRPPVIAIVGAVVGESPVFNWFTNRPLYGQRVLVTRAAEQAQPLCTRLRELGAEVLLQPAIRIGEPGDWQPVDSALKRLDEFDWVVFSSINGVQYLLKRLCDRHGDLRRLGHVKLAAIGPETAQELGRWRLRADVQPSEFRAEALAAALAPQAAGKRFLLVRASRGREVLAHDLSAAGGLVEQVVTYASTDVTDSDPQIAAALADGKIDWVTVTSSAIARSLHAMFGEILRRSKLASISPVTSSTLRELGHEPAIEAKEYTIAGLVTAIVEL